MSLVAVITATCDQCGEQMITTVELTPPPPTEDTIFTVPDLCWADGWPKGWTQIVQPDRSDSDVQLPPVFFHDEACAIAWLRAHERGEEADEMERGDWVWMASSVPPEP